jgi:hypothetical protein
MSERDKPEPSAPADDLERVEPSKAGEPRQPDAALPADERDAGDRDSDAGDRDGDRDGEDRDSDAGDRDSDAGDGDAAAKTRKKAKDGAGSGFLKFLERTYASADPRSLGLFRIALATLLFVDVARRWPDIEAHYANTGWLTNHFMLFRPMSDHLFSVYLAFSTPGEVKTLMAFQLLVCVLFAVGYRTRLMHVLSAILIVSINSRNIMLENGGWVVLNLLTIWTMFLPLGRRFSVDALLASLKLRRETSVAALNEADNPARVTAPVVSLAVAAVIAQWIVIYYFNVVHKQGAEWRNGTAVYYFFQQDRMVTAFGAWVREFFPVVAYRFMTYGALAIEASIALLLALPFRTPITRMVAWLLCISLHLAIDAVVQLGPFSWAMVTAFWLLIPREAWESLGPRWARRFPRRELCLAEGSGFWLSFARVVKRFDVLGKVHYRAVTPSALPASRPEEVDSDEDDGDEDAEEAGERDDGDEDDERDEHAQKPVKARPASEGALERDVAETLVVIDPATGSRYLGLPALYRLFDAVPFGWLLVAPLRIPGISGWVSRLLRRAARQRADADAFFEVEGLPGSPEPLPPAPAKAREAFRGALGVLRESLILVLLIACGSQVLQENRAVPKWLKPTRRPEWMTAIVVYPRMFQGWSMFAPSPPRDDGRLVVDGITKDGRKLDPLTGQAPSFEVQPREGFRMNQIWGDFHRRIGEDRFGAYLDGVREMLKRFHVISGRPEDELKSFELWFVNEHIPPPGGTRAPASRRKIMSWSADETAPPANKRRPLGSKK